MFFNSECGRKVSKKPNLDSYDSRPAANEAQHAKFGFGSYSQELVAKSPAHTNEAYRLLCHLGVNGEVPLAQAMANAGLVATGGELAADGKQVAWFASRPANDNNESAVRRAA